MQKIFIYLFFFLSTLHANLLLQEGGKKYENFSIEYLYDINSSLSIEDIERMNFPQKIPNQFTKGYKSGTAWFKIEIVNNTNNQDFVLYFTEPFWSTLDLYTKENKSWNIQKNALNVLLKDRLIQDNNPAYPLKLQTNKKTILYLKGTTVAAHIGEFQLYTQAEFYRPSRLTLTEIYIIYSFIIFNILIINTYNLIKTKESIYFYYLMYVTTFMIFSSIKSGSYLSFGFHGWPQGLHAVGALLILFLLLFSSKFLKLQTKMPFIYKLFQVFAVLFFLFAMLISFGVPYVSFIFNIVSSIYFMILLFVTIKIWREGSMSAKYYLIALMIFLPTMALMTLTFNTIIDNTDISRYSFLLGALLEFTFFTLILTNRYIDANREKVIAQKALLNEKNNNEEKLILEIEKKTYNLRQSNRELEEQKKELEKTKEQLIIEATTDMLSGLYNRRYFFEASQNTFYNALRYKHELSILMLDIDKFKDVNDNYGHVFGDKIIRIVSNILKNASRESDILARYGGEEFVILLPNTNLEEALNLAERIKLEIQNKKIAFNANETVKITASIGVTQLDQKDDLSIEESIVRCDKALYDAKDSGRNKVCKI